jgi:hypothetical protein
MLNPLNSNSTGSTVQNIRANSTSNIVIGNNTKSIYSIAGRI